MVEAGHLRHAQRPSILVSVQQQKCFCRLLCVTECHKERFLVSMLVQGTFLVSMLVAHGFLRYQSRREHTASRSWYQLRGNQLYQHVTPGLIDEALFVLTVLRLNELDEDIEIDCGIRAFRIEIALDEEMTALKHCKEDLDEHPEQDLNEHTGETHKQPKKMSECRIFYTAGLDDVQVFVRARESF